MVLFVLEFLADESVMLTCKVSSLKAECAEEVTEMNKSLFMHYYSPA